MRHDDVWRAIDTLAAEQGLSPSGLARKAGLDPTSFNVSKRRAADGKARWPSTESIAKVLAATSVGLSDFTALVTGARALPETRSRGRSKIPLIGLAQAGSSGFFD
ncbi:MAG: DNA-binding protein, partial [Acidocella sp. 21-58-7]